MMLLEVADANGLGTARGINLLQVVPCLLPAVCRPVNQIQIHIIHAQAVKAFLECILAAACANIVIPQLGGQEEIAARHTSTANTFTY